MLDRRQFIFQSLRSACLAAVAGSIPQLILPRAVYAAQDRVLVVRTGEDIPQLVRQTVAALGGMERFVKPGETVVVKPNIGWDRGVDLAANTHPLVVKTVVSLCLEAGAKKVQLFDRTCNDPRRCYVSSGIQQAISDLNSIQAELVYMDRRAYKELEISQGKAINRWSFYLPALEADRLINLPIAKHHSISTLTLGMKNLMGVIGGNRGMLHSKIAEALADINTVIHSDLTLIDATRILVANGPQGGRLEDVEVRNTLIASPQVVTADAFASTLFGYQPDQIETIVAGYRRGLGEIDLSRVQRL
ncbi:DUF362 domain-containing protein [Geopsychrobacter electrodiphilus]|uniref:DUF362 domain-containing protein n=1 Tax=Geopsychrobacter electrodiphilus TaxID=225196 RepID=UPI00037573E2|nr:DUF362 domain-containing protein [Geopsychrobacter electrodiphilus]